MDDLALAKPALRGAPRRARRRQPSSRATGWRSTSGGRRPKPAIISRLSGFRTYTSEPPRQTLNIYGGSDYAVTSDGGDYTVHVIGVDPGNRMYLLDLWRGQTSSDIWIEHWCDLVKKWRPSFWAEEHGQIISGVGPFLERRAIERHAYTHREQFPTAVRAQSMRGRMAMLGLCVRQGAPWFADLRAELLSFPAGRHDDQVDALGLVGQLLDKINAGQKPKPPDLTQRDACRPAFEEIPGDNWKTL